MKPLLLKIKGLNSFIEEQHIDFNRLSEGGLFGIFGPTGSGKSTILDGITLALYGKIPRAGGQLNGIVNTQTDTAQVIFKFGLGASGQYSIYQVQRTYKRTFNSKTGHERVSTKAASLYDLSEPDNPKVLYEGQREVNAGIEELIGLNAEDFTRSVVLPQGSFSEFLQMTGGDRGQMLERIFALEEYGEKMSARIKRLKDSQYLQVAQMESLLSAYADVSEDTMTEQRSQLERLKADCLLTEYLWRDVEAKFQKYKLIWEWQEELETYRQQADELNLQKEKINEWQAQIDRAEQAAQIKPLLNRLEQREFEAAERNKKLLVLNRQVTELDEQLMNTRQDWEKACQKRDLEVPRGREKILQLKRGIKIAEEIKQIQNEYDELRRQYQTFSQTLTELKKDLEQKQNEITARLELSNGCRKKLEELKISPHIREKLNHAYEEERQLQQESRKQEELQQYINQLNTGLRAGQLKIKTLTEQHQLKKAVLDELFVKKRNLEENCPGCQEDLLNWQQKNNQLQQEIDTLAAWQQEKKTLQESLAKLYAKKTSLSERFSQEQGELKSQETLRQEYQQLIGQNREKNLAAVLAKKLCPGEACPVCGSTSHPAPVQADEGREMEALTQKHLLLDKQVAEQQALVRQIELELRDLSAKVVYQEQTLAALDERIDGRQLADLQVQAQKNLDYFRELKSAINSWENQQKNTDDQINELKDQLSRWNTEVAALKTAQQKDCENLAKQESLQEQSRLRLQTSQERLNLLCTELGIQQAEEEYLQVLQNDRQAENLESQLKVQQTELSRLETERLSLQEEVNRLDLSRTEITTRGQEKNQLLKQLQAELKTICGEEDPKTALADQEKIITDIENNYQKINSSFEYQKELYTELKQQHSNLKGDLRSLRKVLEQERIEFEQALSQNGFADRVELSKFYRDEYAINQLRQSVQEYNADLALNVAHIQRIEQKLSGFSISTEDWQKLQLRREELQGRREDLKNRLILQEATYNEAEKRWSVRQELHRKKDDLDHEYGLITDLENIFKGKRFIEYIARIQLDYISREASVKLKDITRGRYALELSAEGNFIVRDDYNGGVRRATHTLSGGETFLTSLALALALSSHIQMGRASLEFFFLDEGFGTLDAETLEIVVDALENLRSEKLTVGVISHVEELKQRVARRLIVTQAVPGVSGSTVFIE
ncbi:P-loop containing nucleoside triphosphate hydrolase [Syntrophomonas zehnderi OL-4]|uniref:Nuclease SbcCD subunit C n=2 Tax=Syntrophomonas TaxID=862 RepID=A0A0E4G8S8_9FIRM|nr:P-loop containing nucleoside triphosphate hydrolase [Syntrophomonas zehnderi OL-4]